MRTNGKTEPGNKTLLTKWIYTRAYSSSVQRVAELTLWAHMYNWHHPHGGLNTKPQLSALNLPRDNP